MQTKILEIRDEGTFISVLCVDMNPTQWEIASGAGRQTAEKYAAQRYYLRRCGYPCDGHPNIAMTTLSANGYPCWNDPYGWGGRTRPVAHLYIIEHWAELKDGDVIDVQFINGETHAPKKSERLAADLEDVVPFP